MLVSIIMVLNPISLIIKIDAVFLAKSEGINVIPERNPKEFTVLT